MTYPISKLIIGAAAMVDGLNVFGDELHELSNLLAATPYRRPHKHGPRRPKHVRKARAKRQ